MSGIVKMSDAGGQTNTLPRYISMLAGDAAYVAGAFHSIATIDLGGLTNSTFSSIPQTYQHLQLRLYMPNCSTAPGNIWFYTNGDSTGNKTLHELNGTGYALTSGAATGLPWNRIGYQGATHSYPLVSICTLLDYTNVNKYKTSRVLWGSNRANTSAPYDTYVAQTSGYIPITNAFSSLTVGRDSGSFPTGTQIALYGIEG